MFIVIMITKMMLLLLLLMMMMTITKTFTMTKAMRRYTKPWRLLGREDAGRRVTASSDILVEACSLRVRSFYK